MGMVPPSLVASASRAQYDLAFQTSPIILKNGIVASVQGGLLPLSTITNVNGEEFAKYLPVPGSTLISNAVGMYPFANQIVAANAIIQQPLTLSLRMIAPVNQAGGYLTKLHAFSALQKTLENHNAAAGLYIVATPAFVYHDLIMTAMTDITDEQMAQKQIEWQIDFIKPLVTRAAAATATNGLMSSLQGGRKIAAPLAWSGNPSANAADLAGVTAALAAFGGNL